MTADPEPVQFYWGSIAVFWPLGVLVLGLGLAAELWFGYSGAFENAFLACISLWVIGMIVGTVLFYRRLPRWTEEIKRPHSRPGGTSEGGLDG